MLLLGFAPKRACLGRAAIGICTQPAPSYCDLRSEQGARARQGVALVGVRESAAVVICTQVRCSCAFGVALLLSFTGNVRTVRSGWCCGCVLQSGRGPCHVARAASCGRMSRHVMSRRLKLRCYAVSCPVMSHHVICHVMSSVMSCHVMSCHVTSRHFMPCHVVSCRVLSCRVASCREGRRQHIDAVYLTLTLCTLTPLTLTQLIFIPLAFAQLALTPLTLMRPRSSVYQP